MQPFFDSNFKTALELTAAILTIISFNPVTGTLISLLIIAYIAFMPPSQND